MSATENEFDPADRIIRALGRCQQAHTSGDGKVSVLYLSVEDAGEILAQALRARREQFVIQDLYDRSQEQLSRIQEEQSCKS